MRGSLITAFAGVGSCGAAAHLYLTGETGAAAALAGVAIAFLGLTAWLHGLLSGRAARGAKRVGRRAAPPAFALLLIMSVVGGPVGTASADWVDCNFSDPLLGAAYNTLTGADEGCRWDSGNQTDVENLTATDAYSNSLSLKDSANSYTASVGNYQETYDTVLYSKGKIELVNNLEEGKSVSLAKQNVNATVENEVARHEVQIIKDWNSKMTQVEYLSNTSLEMRWYEMDAAQYLNVTNLKTFNYTLANGSTYGIKVFNTSDGSVIHRHMTPVDLAAIDGKAHGVLQTQDPADGTWTNITDTRDYSNGWSDGSVSNSGYAQLLQSPSTQATQVKDNLAPYADEVYNQYNAGELNTTDLAKIDPAVIGQEAATSLNSTGYYSHASIMLASIGAAGDVNVSHNITAGGTQLDGTLFYTGDDAPTNGWNTSQTYNMTDYNGTFYMAVAKESGNATIVDLETYGETFTINEATNTDTGESVNTTTTRTYTYDSTNASNLEAELDRLRDLRAQYETALTASGGAAAFGLSQAELAMAGGGGIAIIYFLGRGA